jgi:hypothetical protein
VRGEDAAITFAVKGPLTQALEPETGENGNGVEANREEFFLQKLTDLMRERQLLYCTVTEELLLSFNMVVPDNSEGRFVNPLCESTSTFVSH